VDNEVVEVLKEIRDEVKGTNVRLDQTNTRLESLEIRVDTGLASLGERVDQTNTRLESLEGRVESGFSTLDGRLRFVEKRLKDGFDELSVKIETVSVRQLEAEANTTAEISAVGGLIMGLHSKMVEIARDHEKRISALEKRR